MTIVDYSRAVCVGADPGLFDVDATDGAHREAARICGACPIAAACLVWAVDHGEYGVYGGLLVVEGRVRGIPPSSHESCGTLAGWDRHRARHEAPCTDCRETDRVRRNAAAAALHRRPNGRCLRCDTSLSGRRVYYCSDDCCYAIRSLREAAARQARRAAVEGEPDQVAVQLAVEGSPPRHLTARERDLVIARLLSAGMPEAEIVRRARTSYATVRRLRGQLAAAGAA